MLAVRAKISDRDRRFDLVQQECSTFEREAVLEVEAILAEVEPEIGEGPSPFNPKATVRGFYVDLGCVRTNPGLVAKHYGVSYARPHADALLALVEGLSAFAVAEIA